MQAEKPCPQHEHNQISQICLTKQCEHARIFCESCLASHNKHQVIPYKQYQKKYGEYSEIYGQGVERIRKSFQKVRETFMLCIKRAEERVCKEYLLCYNAAGLPKLTDIEAQQLYGIVHNTASDQKFKQILIGDTPIQKWSKELQKNLQSMSVYTEQLNTNIMASINKLMSQIMLTIANPQAISQQKPPSLSLSSSSSSHFRFTDKLKPPIYTITEQGHCLSRTSTINEGLSMYAVVDQPLSREHDRVSFTIVRQERRFIYFGVCDQEVFRNFGFKGHLYAIGNRMWAIRQSPKVGANAVSLHNSLQEYSNVDKVPFDFDVGDIITIRYFESKNSITFIKNDKETFQMPLDKSITKFYPFVGLKFNKDCVRVLGEEEKEKKKGGIFESLFKSSIK